MDEGKFLPKLERSGFYWVSSGNTPFEKAFNDSQGMFWQRTGATEDPQQTIFDILIEDYNKRRSPDSPIGEAERI